MNWPKILLVFGLGCLATASQVQAVREFLALFAGNELTLGVVFGAWLLGISAGAAIGGRLAEPSERTSARLQLAVAALFALALAAPCAVRVWRFWLAVPVGELPSLDSLLAAAVCLITPLSALIGLTFPLACRMASRGQDPLAIGRVYVLESAGAVAGGLLVSVLAAGRLAPLAAVALASLPLLVGWTALSATTRSRRSPVTWVAGAASATVAVGLAVGGFSALDARSAAWRFDSLQTGGRLLAAADTPYQHLDLGEHGGQFDLLADGKVLASFPDPYRSAPRAHLVLCQHPAPDRVLLLSAVPFEFAVEALQHPLRRLDVVVLDRALLELVQPWLAPRTARILEQPRVRLHLTDGRRLLRATTRRWDLIAADVPDPATAADNRFYTREFFELVHSRLRPGGVFATRLGSSVNVLGGETAALVRTVRDTLRPIFEHVLLLPGEETWFFASDDPAALLTDPVQLAGRWRSRGLSEEDFAPERFVELVQPELVADLEAQLDAIAPPPLNTDARPITYLQYLVRWSHLSGDSAGALLARLSGPPAGAWFGGLLGLLALGAGLVLPRRVPAARLHRRCAALAVLVVGALGLGLELILSLAYQGLAGRLYQELGLIVAAFMAGLVGAGYLTNRWLERHDAGPVSLGLALAGLAALAVAATVLQDASGLLDLPAVFGPLLLLVLVLLVGAGTGTLFPLASRVAAQGEDALGHTAGFLDALDHLGAAGGALLTSLVLVPALGRAFAGWWLSAACLGTALLCLAAGRRKDISKG